MLQLMDTAIAFAVVMLLLSLLITAVVQAVSALLDLRGKILQKHIEMLLRQVSPGFRDTFTKLQQKGEAEEKNPDSGTPAKPNGTTVASVIAAAVVYHPALAQGQGKSPRSLPEPRPSRQASSWQFSKTWPQPRPIPHWTQPCKKCSKKSF